MIKLLRNSLANMAISRIEKSISTRLPFRYNVFSGPKYFWILEDITIGEDETVESISSANFSITLWQIEWQSVFPAIWREVLQRHTSQNNQSHPQAGLIQISSGT